MKRTATNTPALATIKKLFNAKIYKRALSIYNEQGATATTEYIAKFSPSAALLLGNTE